MENIQQQLEIYIWWSGIKIIHYRGATREWEGGVLEEQGSLHKDGGTYMVYAWMKLSQGLPIMCSWHANNYTNDELHSCPFLLHSN